MFYIYLTLFYLILGGRPAPGDDDHAAGRATPKRRHTPRRLRRARWVRFGRFAKQ